MFLCTNCSGWPCKCPKMATNEDRIKITMNPSNTSLSICPKCGIAYGSAISSNAPGCECQSRPLVMKPTMGDVSKLLQDQEKLRTKLRLISRLTKTIQTEVLPLLDDKNKKYWETTLTTLGEICDE